MSWQVIAGVAGLLATFCFMQWIEYLRYVEDGRREHSKRILRGPKRSVDHPVPSLGLWGPRPRLGPPNVIPIHRKVGEEIDQRQVTLLMDLADAMPPDEGKKFLEAHGIMSNKRPPNPHNND